MVVGRILTRADRHDADELTRNGAGGEGSVDLVAIANLEHSVLLSFYALRLSWGSDNETHRIGIYRTHYITVR